VLEALAIMEKRTNTRNARYQSNLEIVQVLFDEWCHSNTALADAFEYELDPLFNMHEYLPPDQTMQLNESDAAFVRPLPAPRGRLAHRAGPQPSRGIRCGPQRCAGAAGIGECLAAAAAAPLSIPRRSTGRSPVSVSCLGDRRCVSLHA
jgi:hypothetical protein